jgi:hypothetical protein
MALALAAGFGPQIVWNRSTRLAHARGGARVGRPRWLRILINRGDDLQGAAVGAVFHVDIENHLSSRAQLISP